MEIYNTMWRYIENMEMYRKINKYIKDIENIEIYRKYVNI